MVRFTLALFLTAAAIAQPPAAKLFKPNLLRALILSGRNDHDWRTTTPRLKQILLSTGRFDVRVDEEPAGITAQTLELYDVLVLDYNGPRLGAATEKAIEDFVRSGKGLATYHGDSYAFGDTGILGDGHVPIGVSELIWPEYRKMLGSWWTADGLKKGHGSRHTFPVKFVKPDHPIAQGMGESFLATDELYHSVTMGPQAQVIATAFDDPKMRGFGRNEPIVWTVDYGKGRVFHTTLGHDLTSMYESGFVTIFARGTEWAATGKVTLPAAIPPEVRQPNPLRILIVTGGHPHETTFYSLFEGYDDWAVSTDAQPNALASSRERFDVIVFYDLQETISETNRKNLKDFVESGKGIVSLHHAIVDFTDWPWWYQEVIGGKFYIKPEPGHPASTAKANKEMYVKQDLKHPITRNIGPLHLWDEPYKFMWVRPDAHVILETDHPLADRQVGWISPYEKSRVVYIQLGHDRRTHLHPTYRNLIRNAVEWAGGRLK
jgi:type 1 glutamine amidotransferase